MNRGAVPASLLLHLDAILDGTEPDGLSLEKVHRPPVEWREQRGVLRYRQLDLVGV